MALIVAFPYTFSPQILPLSLLLFLEEKKIKTPSFCPGIIDSEFLQNSFLSSEAETWELEDGFLTHCR